MHPNLNSGCLHVGWQFSSSSFCFSVFSKFSKCLPLSSPPPTSLHSRLTLFSFFRCNSALGHGSSGNARPGSMPTTSSLVLIVAPVTLCAWLHRSKWLRLDAGCLAPYPAVPATRELIPLCHFILTWIQWRLDNRLQDSDFWNVEQDHSLGNNFLL